MKELLGEELYNQVKEKIGDKEFFVNDGTYIPKKKFDDLNNDKKELQQQLLEVQEKVKELSNIDNDKLKKDLEELTQKYETDTKELNEKWNKREREYLVNDLTRDLKFSSNGAKKSFIEELIKKDLKIENGQMLGFNDFLTEYQNNDPNTFVPKTKNEGKDIILGDVHKELPKEKSLQEDLRERLFGK